MESVDCVLCYKVNSLPGLGSAVKPTLSNLIIPASVPGKHPTPEKSPRKHAPWIPGLRWRHRPRRRRAPVLVAHKELYTRRARPKGRGMEGLGLDEERREGRF